MRDRCEAKRGPVSFSRRWPCSWRRRCKQVWPRTRPRAPASNPKIAAATVTKAASNFRMRAMPVRPICMRRARTRSIRTRLSNPLRTAGEKRPGWQQTSDWYQAALVRGGRRFRAFSCATRLVSLPQSRKALNYMPANAASCRAVYRVGLAQRTAFPTVGVSATAAQLSPRRRAVCWCTPQTSIAGRSTAPASAVRPSVHRASVDRPNPP